MYEFGYYILVDLVYAIEYFLLPPYDSSNPRPLEDDFNFYHLSAHITMKCVFGEIGFTCGIVWKMLTYSIANATIIVEGAIQMHNFIVDYRDEHADKVIIVNEMELFQEVINNSDSTMMVVGNYLRFSGNILINE